VGAILQGTLTTDDLDRGVAAWRELLGYRVVSDGPLGDELAESWGAPNAAGRRSVLLQPESGSKVCVRWVERAPGTKVPAPLTSFGWAALEITVEDADALHEALVSDGRFSILGPPTELEFTDRIYPMQCQGPAGEVVYLNEVRGSMEDFDLPVAASPVDQIFIVVLASPDLEASLQFYTERFGFDRGNAYEIPYTVINRAFGFPEDRRHRLAMTCVGRRVNVEADQYPVETIPRPELPGDLPSGIASITLAVASLDGIGETLGPIVRPGELPYDGRRTATVRGPAGERIELVEVGEAGA